MTDQTLSTTAADASLFSLLSFNPNPGQEQAIYALIAFVQPENPDRICILRGCAGTGKTSIVKVLTDYLHQQQTPFALAAPTGRAAQVIGRKTGNGARTLHATIFTPEAQEDGSVRFLEKPNPSADFTVYIIDEASMIPDMVALNNSGFSQDSSTLSRLVDYVKQGNPKSKIIFIGDTNQLPPIENPDFSPALNSKYLSERFGLPVTELVLTEIMRQQNGSYVLDNAENLRNAIEQNQPMINLRCRNLRSFSNAVQSYLSMLDDDRDDSAVMIAHTNRQVNAMNTWARKFRFHYKDRDPLKVGDLLMLNKNTIKNETLFMRGTSLRVLEVRPSKPFADLHFVNANLAYTNTEGHEQTMVSKILVDTLVNENGTLPHQVSQRLVHEAIKHNRKFRESRKSEDDPYVGALRVRYGYALTCHKAQGGEWEHVFLNPLYRRDDLRWCYTAITRASQHLYCWPITQN